VNTSKGGSKTQCNHKKLGNRLSIAPNTTLIINSLYDIFLKLNAFEWTIHKAVIAQQKNNAIEEADKLLDVTPNQSKRISSKAAYPKSAKAKFVLD